MAKMRHTAGWADWQEVDPEEPCRVCPWTHPERLLHRARLENGHELHAWSWDDTVTGIGKNGPDEYGWSWAIVDPSKYPAKRSKYEHHQDAHLAGDGGDGGDYDDPGHTDYIPTLEQAKQQAEQHYQKMFPIGTDTGPHDSGVDYSDLNSFKDFL